MSQPSSTVQWFLDNQRMTSHDPATQTPEEGALEGAQDLAMAEQHATEHGWWVTWELDQTQDEPGDLVAMLWGEVDGEAEVLASMGGVEAEATDEWRRAIAAELALEAIFPA